MGLDVYLYRCDNLPLAKQLEQEYETQSDRIWKEVAGDRKYDDLSEAERDKITELTDEFAKKLGLGEFGSHPSRQGIEEDSKKYPEHYFKIGYFRSSYNSSGINSVMQRLGIPGLYEIFDKDGDESDFTPNWNESLERAKDALQKLQKFMASDKAKFDCCEVHNYGDEGQPSEPQQALALFYKQLEAGSGMKGGYSCKDGDFYLNCDPMKVRAVIPGGKPKYGFGVNSVFVVYEVDPDKAYKYYVEALEIVIETIEYVLAQPDAENYYFGWSG